ncbi:MAG: RNA polymerase sigma factor [Cytophagales bacterium]|nr:RNA polymerase sigma factor [Cytophagales bacterium]
MKQKDFFKIYQKIQDKLYRLALRMVNDRSEAEDIVQDSFLKIWKDPGQLSQCRNIEAWCMRIVKNRSLDILRQSKLRSHENIENEWQYEGSHQTPHRQLETADGLAHLRKKLCKLPEKQRLVFQLRDIEGYAYQEIEKIAELNSSQVKVYLFRARKALREHLEKSYHYESGKSKTLS